MVIPFTKMDIIGQILFIAIIISFILFIFYIIPFFFAWKSYIFSEREKRRKRSMLNQIMTQKEIEDEVEREIREEEIRKQWSTK